MTTFLNPPGVFGPTELVSQAAVADPDQALVLLSGQVAWGDDGAFVGIGDHAAQVAQIVSRLDVILAEIGATRADIVKETIYVVDHRPDLVPFVIGPLREGVSVPPASTYIGVQTLYAPEALVEIDFVISVPRARLRPSR